ncbi:Ras GTPase [Acrasis kona]|uniref:Ras GTPase n=1 Tax=Acrasis kona TaxID=1008807 RepID=A0AAW2Z050_9EUKA
MNRASTRMSSKRDLSNRMKRIGTINLSHFSEAQMPKIHEYKIAVVGPHKSGKTCIVTRFLSGEFGEDYDHTIEDVHYKNSNININSVMPSITSDVNEIICKLTIVDTSGLEEEFSQVNENEVADSDAFIFVADLSDEDTLNKVKFFYERVCDLQADKIQGLTMFDATVRLPIVLVQNKEDEKVNDTIQQDLGEWAEQNGIPYFPLDKSGNVQPIYESAICQVVHNVHVLPLISDTSCMPNDPSSRLSKDSNSLSPNSERKSVRQSLGAAMQKLIGKTIKT